MGGFRLDPASFKGLQGAHSMANLRNMANKLGDINVSNFDELMGGKELGDELTALHYQNYNFTSKTLKKGD